MSWIPEDSSNDDPEDNPDPFRIPRKSYSQVVNKVLTTPRKTDTISSSSADPDSEFTLEALAREARTLDKTSTYALSHDVCDSHSGSTEIPPD
jgi:hypothetical protein